MWQLEQLIWTLKPTTNKFEKICFALAFGVYQINMQWWFNICAISSKITKSGWRQLFYLIWLYVLICGKVTHGCLIYFYWALNTYCPKLLFIVKPYFVFSKNPLTCIVHWFIWLHIVATKFALVLVCIIFHDYLKLFAAVIWNAYQFVWKSTKLCSGY